MNLRTEFNISERENNGQRRTPSDTKKAKFVLGLDIGGLLAFCLFLLVGRQAWYLTYSAGYAGLVIRPVAAALLLAIFLWAAWFGRKPGKSVLYISVAVVSWIMLALWMDVVPSLRDFSAQPVTHDYYFRIHYSSSSKYRHYVITTYDENGDPTQVRFHLSRFETISDGNGNAVFDPYWFIGSNRSSMRRLGREIPPFLRATFTYYPHSGTRVEMRDVREIAPDDWPGEVPDDLREELRLQEIRQQRDATQLD